MINAYLMTFKKISNQEDFLVPMLTCHMLNQKSNPSYLRNMLRETLERLETSERPERAISVERPEPERLRALDKLGLDDEQCDS